LRPRRGASGPPQGRSPFRFFFSPWRKIPGPARFQDFAAPFELGPECAAVAPDSGRERHGRGSRRGDFVGRAGYGRGAGRYQVDSLASPGSSGPGQPAVRRPRGRRRGNTWGGPPTRKNQQAQASGLPPIFSLIMRELKGDGRVAEVRATGAGTAPNGHLENPACPGLVGAAFRVFLDVGPGAS